MNGSNIDNNAERKENKRNYLFDFFLVNVWWFDPLKIGGQTTSKELRVI
jgi:hypothetical protein